MGHGDAPAPWIESPIAGRSSESFDVDFPPATQVTGGVADGQPFAPAYEVVADRAAGCALQSPELGVTLRDDDELSLTIIGVAQSPPRGERRPGAMGNEDVGPEFETRGAPHGPLQFDSPLLSVRIEGADRRQPGDRSEFDDPDALEIGSGIAALAGRCHHRE